jgi:hypothetical protein
MESPIVLDTPEQILAYRYLVLRKQMSLMIRLPGLRFKGRNVFTVIKKEFSLKGSRASILAQFELILRETGILKDDLLPMKAAVCPACGTSSKPVWCFECGMKGLKEDQLKE